MAKLIIIIIFFLLSLLCLFRAPIYILWYVAILVEEFPWIFISVSILLVIWATGGSRYHTLNLIVSIATLLLFASPVIRAYGVAHNLDKNFEQAFGKGTAIIGTGSQKPFSISKMITGIGAKEAPYKTLVYDAANNLRLDYYPSQISGTKPCVVVVHGGSWKGGDSKQLPELNSYLAKEGYNVVSINYRLAPRYTSPAPVEDVHTTLAYLRQHAAKLNIDTNNFVLLGRSAGGQIVMAAAYDKVPEPGLKGVISFYGPADMIWGYRHPANPLVFNSTKVMQDFIGGTLEALPQKYAEASPIENVTAQSIPTLLIQGKNDVLVAYQHAVHMNDKMNQLGVKHFFLSLPWATHGCDYTLNGPSGQLSVYTIDRFLRVVMKTPNP